MQPIYSNLSNEEQEAISLYKGNNPFDNELCFSDHVNTCLGKGNTLPVQWEDKAKILDFIITAASDDVDHILYRATIENYLPVMNTGADFVYPSYMSTAVEEHSAKKHFGFPFRGITAVLLKINCPAGSPLLDMEIKDMFGGMEQERLLPRNSKFNVKSIEHVSDKLAMYQTLGVFTDNYSLLNIIEVDFVGIA